MDDQVGRFMQSLIEYQLYHNTVILFVSDHGELLGDHNFLAKSLAYEGSAKIPFILSDPGDLLGIKKGTTCDKVVELRDIMPTLLDAAEIKIPETVEGKSVIPLAKEKDTYWREYLHGEHTYGDLSHHFIVNGKEKYIWYSQTGEEQYFNLEEDPKELNNLINDERNKEKITFLRKKLIKELEEREEGYSDGTKLIVGCKPKAILNSIFN
ncbi:sulfatase/phosphatase domain-containing protein [Bacillus sp. FJAT-49711]|uniref:sulfatase/phosphatase domain-containing protein n=1 Tax=Bacillus sp. FJAT-49711 TaxID=2833585 RepID=UPI0032D56EAF